jgi:hypothetical protein
MVPVLPGSLPILPPQHEEFAQMISLGASAAEAYRKHISPTVENDSLWASASRLTKLDKVAERVSYLKAQAGKVALRHFGIDAETLILKHMEIISTPIGEIDETHPLCTKMKRSRRITGAGGVKQVWEVEEVAKPCVSRSLEALANLCGLNAAMKTETMVRTADDDTEDLLKNPAALNAFGWMLQHYPEAAQEIRNGLEGRVCGDNGEKALGEHGPALPV